MLSLEWNAVGAAPTLLQLHLSGEQFIAYHGAAYIICLKVMLIFAEIDITAWELYIAIGPNIVRPRQNGRHFADDIFKCITIQVPIQV